MRQVRAIGFRWRASGPGHKHGQLANGLLINTISASYRHHLSTGAIAEKSRARPLYLAAAPVKQELISAADDFNDWLA